MLIKIHVIQVLRHFEYRAEFRKFVWELMVISLALEVPRGRLRLPEAAEDV